MTDDYSGNEKKERIVIMERRKAKRILEENEITINVTSREPNRASEKIIYTLGKNISTRGVKIQGNTTIPIDTLLKIKIALSDPPQILNAFGKIKWVKMLSSSGLYEAGLEFINTSGETIQQLANYVSRKA
jgi:hypothetical protein